MAYTNTNTYRLFYKILLGQVHRFFFRKERNTNIVNGIYNSRTFTGSGNYETVRTLVMMAIDVIDDDNDDD